MSEQAFSLSRVPVVVLCCHPVVRVRALFVIVQNGTGILVFLLYSPGAASSRPPIEKKQIDAWYIPILHGRILLEHHESGVMDKTMSFFPLRSRKIGSR